MQRLIIIQYLSKLLHNSTFSINYTTLPQQYIIEHYIRY